MNDSRMDSQWPGGTLLGRIDEAAGKELLRQGVLRKVDTGATILRQGDRGTHVIVLRDAVVKVTATTADGVEALLSVRVTGDIVGEMSALNDWPRSATVITCRPSRIVVIQQAELKRFLVRHPEVALQLVATVADRLRWANQRRMDFAAYSVKSRLIRLIAELASTYGYRTQVGLTIGVELTQPELATLTGAAQVTVQKALRELRRDGLIHTGYRQVTVVDLDRLRALAHETAP